MHPGAAEQNRLAQSKTPPTVSSQHDHPLNPICWRERRKWTVNLVACYVTFIVGLNATALTAVAGQTNDTFHISDQDFPNSVWPVTAWNTGAALAPMVVLPIMENHGMRPGYLATYFIFFLFVVPQAVAQNLSTFITCRFFAGCCGGILQDAMDGIIADMWEKPPQRSIPVSVYVFALLSGVSMGPVVGGLIAQSLHWRWIFYIQLIIYGVSALPVFLLFRETRVSVIISNKTKEPSEHKSRYKSLMPTLRVRKPTWTSESIRLFIKDNILLPSYLLTTEPVVFSFTLLSALSYGLLFMATQSVPQVYSSLFAFTEPQTGLIQASIVVGEVLGLLVCVCIGSPYFANAYAKSISLPGGGPQLAEVRLHPAIPSLFIGVTGGLFIYGWTSYAEITYWAPAIGLLLLGFSSMVVMQAIMMYITDAYVKYAASASAAVCFGENVFAAFLPLASQSMYTNLGFQWASSLLAFVALLLSAAPVVLVWKGSVIRERSPFMREMMNEKSARHREDGHRL